MNFGTENTNLWLFIMQMGLICAVLLTANVLRTKLPIIRKALMPTSVIAGFLLLGVRYSKLILVDVNLLEMITYHGIALGFIALSLRTKKNQTEGEPKFLALKNGALIVSTYVVQAITGLIISLILSYTFIPYLFKASGILLPMGFGQGPGQANNIGGTYEAQGFLGGRSYGLAIAATGFLCACIIGVIYLNFLRKKKKKEISNASIISGSITVDIFQDENEIPISESIDRFSIQIAFIILIYSFTYILMLGSTRLISNYAPALTKLLSPLIWGFNFMIGSGLAVLYKVILKHLKKNKIMNHQYCNNYLLNRISGFAFDLMIVAGIASINIEEIEGLWIPFIITVVAGGFVTFFFVKFITKKLYPKYSEEAFISMFGMLTGTISSGILLLREIDPLYKTPAANNLITGTGAAIIFAVPVLLLIGLAPQSEMMTLIVLGLAVIYFLILMCILLSGKKRANKI